MKLDVTDFNIIRESFRKNESKVHTEAKKAVDKFTENANPLSALRYVGKMRFLAYVIGRNYNTTREGAKRSIEKTINKQINNTKEDVYNAMLIATELGLNNLYKNMDFCYDMARFCDSVPELETVVKEGYEYMKTVFEDYNKNISLIF